MKRAAIYLHDKRVGTLVEDADVDSAKAAYVATCIELGVIEIDKYSISELNPNMNIGNV